MKAIIIISLTLFFLQTTISLSCLDYNGNPVEWWSIIQIPEEEKNYTGYAHLYFDSTMGSSSDFKYFQTDPDKKDTALYNTIQSTQSSSYMVIMWNDEDPITKTTLYAPTAHSKGYIALDTSSKNGYYLLHSIVNILIKVIFNKPKYPNIANNNIDPTIDYGERLYGQSAMCMSASAYELEKIAGNMLIIEADVYWTQSLSTSYPNLYNLGKQKVPSSPLYSIANITLNSGTKLTMFSKNGNLQEYIYEQIMVPYLKCSLYCETWGNPYWQYAWCNCTSNNYFVKEITKISLPSNNIYWESTNDHSKWAIGNSEDNPYVCFGDLNKMTAQDKRGGNYMCLKNKNMWTLFNSIVDEYQYCQDYS